MKREWIACTSLTAAALVVHLSATSWLATRDVIALGTSGHVLLVLAVVGPLVCARLVLLFVPGWWLWLLARAGWRHASR
jgi:hypothetical protein